MSSPLFTKDFFYNDNLYPINLPAALYDFQKIEDLNYKNEVKLITNLKQHTMVLFNAATDLEKKHKKTHNKLGFNLTTDEQVASVKYLKTLIPNDLKDNRYITDIYKSEFEELVFSIAGGYCRNHLMGTNFKTDVDLVISSGIAMAALSLQFKELETDSGIKAYSIPGNQIHIINHPFSIYETNEGKIDFRREREDTIRKHLFVNPVMFDFTVNCACISSTDGCLYASPITIYDIENKILRPTRQALPDFNPSELLRVSIAVRAVRFALKYDMQIHDMLYTAIKSLFRLQHERETIDDTQAYHALKHLYNDPIELREEVYKTLKKLKMYETDKYDNLDDYFSHIKTNFDDKPRNGRIITNYSGLSY